MTTPRAPICTTRCSASTTRPTTLNPPWQALSAGAALMRRRHAYDAAREAAWLDAIMRTPLPRPTPGGGDGPRPVFIVGMPRTGTTLLDRILGNHPAVHSLGSATTLAASVSEATGRFFHPAADDGMAGSFDGAEVEATGRLYLQRTRTGVPTATHLVDKNPLNLYCIPLILRALPHARVVVMRREPMDACFSNLKELLGWRVSLQLRAGGPGGPLPQRAPLERALGRRRARRGPRGRLRGPWHGNRKGWPRRCWNSSDCPPMPACTTSRPTPRRCPRPAAARYARRCMAARSARGAATPGSCSRCAGCWRSSHELPGAEGDMAAAVRRRGTRRTPGLGRGDRQLRARTGAGARRSLHTGAAVLRAFAGRALPARQPACAGGRARRGERSGPVAGAAAATAHVQPGAGDARMRGAAVADVAHADPAAAGRRRTAELREPARPGDRLPRRGTPGRPGLPAHAVVAR
ncbi:sulfotransferase [Pseudoxanthomonas sp. NC8]|nr:sulfotransferase [Pseudoxanthomonas sp. NC8]